MILTLFIESLIDRCTIWSGMTTKGVISLCSVEVHYIIITKKEKSNPQNEKQIDIKWIHNWTLWERHEVNTTASSSHINAKPSDFKA